MNQFVESIKRLYQSGKVDEKKIDKLRKNNKITDIEKKYILEAH